MIDHVKHVGKRKVSLEHSAKDLQNQCNQSPQRNSEIRTRSNDKKD